MDVAKVLAQLRAELDLIDKAISQIESMGLRDPHRHGRPLGLVTKSDRTRRAKVSSKQSTGRSQ